ncbi:MAG: tyrosine-protein phosphatase [Methanocorpusculum sp.]|nr:tyrosine-protein phosphatase [Methanocorpusculum sp.]
MMSSSSKTWRILLLALAAGCIALGIAGAGCIAQNNGPSLTCGLAVNEKFSTINLGVSSEDFRKAGFAPGDSLTFSFSNGVVCSDVPYLTGLVVKGGTLIALERSTFGTIELVVVNVGNEWDTIGVTKDDTVTVSVAKSQGSAGIQQLNTLRYTKDPADFPSHEAFANFRAAEGGTLKENFIYRGASSVDNLGNRVKIVNELIEKAGVKTVVDLADSAEQIKEMQESAEDKDTYFERLSENGNVLALGMSTAYNSPEYAEKLADGLKAMTKMEGPFYIQCLEGKNRTGFVCMLLEALCGASYEEMEADYMKTYENYYGITKESDASAYTNICDILFDEQLRALTDDLSQKNYIEPAKAYLRSGGMSDDEITLLIQMISS